MVGDEKKKVAIQLRVYMQVEVPADWDDDMILFFYNDSSHCLNNEIERLAREEAAHPGVCNLCSRAEVVLAPEWEWSDE